MIEAIIIISSILIVAGVIIGCFVRRKKGKKGCGDCSHCSIGRDCSKK